MDQSVASKFEKSHFLLGLTFRKSSKPRSSESCKSKSSLVKMTRKVVTGKVTGTVEHWDLVRMLSFWF